MNKIVLTLGGINSLPASPWEVGFMVKIKNSVDNVKNHQNNNSDDIKGYKEKHELQNIMRQLKSLIKNAVTVLSQEYAFVTEISEYDLLDQIGEVVTERGYFEEGN